MENAESITFANEGGAVKSNNIIGDVNQTTIHQYGSAAHQPLSKPIRFEARNSDPNFTGRSEEMRRLDQCFEKSPYIAVVCGLGGIGKTSLVRKYVESKQFESYNVIWINAKQGESIRKDFESVASITALNTDGVRKDFKSVSDAVLSKLCKFPTLIVLDNVDDEDVQKYVLENVLNLRPSGDHRPRFVLTSRIQKWSRNSVHVMPLRGLGDMEAVELVTKLLTNNEPNDEEECPYNDSTEDIRKLIEILESFPLIIRQATAYINNQREVRPFSINDYIDEYNSCRQELLDSKLFQDETFLEYKETTFTTWTVTIEAIARNASEGNLAIRILRIIAYFEADHIQRNIFFHLNHPFTGNKIDEKEIISAVRLLVKYSLIEGHKRQSVLSIHRLVQSVMKIDLESKDMSRTTLRDGLNIIHKRLKQQKLEDASQTFEHGMSVFLSVLEKEDLAKEFSFFPSIVFAKAFDCGEWMERMNFGDLLSHNAFTFESAILVTFTSIGKHAKAFEMFRDVYAKRVQIFGADHPDTFTIRTSIAVSHSDVGKRADVLLMLQEVYAKRLRTFGADHADVITIKFWIADALNKMEKHDEALQMFQDVYAKREQIFGADHPETITVQSQIANSFLKMGNYVDAEQTLQNIYGKQLNTLGDTNPDTVTTESRIADLFFKMGKYPEALQMFQNIYGKQVNTLGDTNPETVTTESRIADLFFKMGKYPEALQMFQDLCDKEMKHFYVFNKIRFKFWIAVSFLQMEKYTDALQIFREVYERRDIFLRAYPHSDTITMDSSAAVSYLSMGKYADALEIFDEIYAKLAKIFGGDHQHTVTIKSWITGSFHEMGQYADAVQKFEHIHQKLWQIYEKNSCNKSSMHISSCINYLIPGRIESEFDFKIQPVGNGDELNVNWSCSNYLFEIKPEQKLAVEKNKISPCGCLKIFQKKKMETTDDD